MKNNKGIASILIVLIIVGVLALGGGIYYFLVKNSQKPISCTQEAKLCPDGSYVSRTGPNCEFTQCPDVKKDETADWKTYRNEEYGFEIKYPSFYNIVNETEQGQQVTIGNAAIPAYGISIVKSDVSSLEKLKSNMEKSLRNLAPAGLKITMF